MNYSMEANTSVEDMVGIEYDTCCWTVRLMHLRYYDNVSGQVPTLIIPTWNGNTPHSFRLPSKVWVASATGLPTLWRI